MVSNLVMSVLAEMRGFMDIAESSAIARFRAAGRQVLRQPSDAQAHERRVAAASALGGAEPLQAALADWLYACPAQRVAQKNALYQPHVLQGLGSVLWRRFARELRWTQHLPRVNHLASRWAVLTQPSSDVPQRALLCGVDDSRELAELAVAAILAGDAGAETAFLTHCVGSQDTLSFMLARRSLQRAHFPLNAAWLDATQALQQRS